jgi:thioredoxin 1
MAIQIVDDAGFRTEVLDSSQPVLVDFYADWCGPCKMLAPVLEKVADQFAGKVRFLKLNTDDSPRTAQDYQVRGIPTLLLFQAGQPIERKVGFVNEAELTKFIEKNVNPEG